MPYHSPLRYPGGKGLLLDFMAELVRANTPRAAIYVEPFAGGAAIAIGLLKAGAVDAAVLGDVDPAIAAFWRAATRHPDELAERIARCEVTIDAWHEQFQVLAEQPPDDVALGFAALFLNRTNYSGVLRARPIGGLNQNGPYPLDCRFDKASLLGRLRAVAGLAGRISVHQTDAVELLGHLGADPGSPVFVYADPPYLNKSSDLYLDTMTYDSHQALAQQLHNGTAWWVASYDDDPRVNSELYPTERILRFALRHSAHRAHQGRELMAFSPQCATDSATGLLNRAHWLN